MFSKLKGFFRASPPDPILVETNNLIRYYNTILERQRYDYQRNGPRLREIEESLGEEIANVVALRNAALENNSNDADLAKAKLSILVSLNQKERSLYNQKRLNRINFQGDELRIAIEDRLVDLRFIWCNANNDDNEISEIARLAVCSINDVIKAYFEEGNGEARPTIVYHLNLPIDEYFTRKMGGNRLKFCYKRIGYPYRSNYSLIL